MFNGSVAGRSNGQATSKRTAQAGANQWEFAAAFPSDTTEGVSERITATLFCAFLFASSTERQDSPRALRGR